MKQIIRGFIAVVLVVALLVCPTFAASFPDVDGNAEYAEAVEYLSETGIMVGDDKGNFNPDKTVTRAEMATIICRMLGETEGLTTSDDFTDVPTNHWANAYISKAAELGIVGGYGNGKFGPSDNVTYEQAVTMIVRAIGQDSAANAVGGYPNGFISVASAGGYLEGISAKNGDQMVRWQIAVICYNVIMGGTGE